VRIEACSFEGDEPPEDQPWVEILPHKPLGPSAHHYHPCKSFESWTHLRVNIYPDGGIARLRAYGVPELSEANAKGEIDLAAALNGGRILGFSDAHYGDYMRLLAPGRGINMGDGWETRRRSEPGYDWMIIALGARGEIEKASSTPPISRATSPTRLDPGSRSEQFRRRADRRAHHRLDVLERASAAAETDARMPNIPSGKSWSVLAPSPMCASTSSPMAASRACACSGRRLPEAAFPPMIRPLRRLVPLYARMSAHHP
jgi:hypothetical protein